MREEDQLRTAQVLNDIFHLPLGWHSVEDGPRERIDEQAIHDLRDALPLLGNLLQDPTLLNAIWALTQNRDLLRVAIDEPSTLRSLNIGSETRAELAEQLRKQNFLLAFKFLLQRSNSILPLGGGATHDQTSRLVDEFFDLERIILKSAGLDQASIATILAYLMSKRSRIIDNLVARAVLYPAKYLGTVDVVISDVSRMGGMRSRDGHIATKLMRRVRQKLVCLATIWADAIPVVFGHDWGVAGVLSCTAGATVGAIMPSDARS